MNNNARPNNVGTGAVMNMPGGRVHDSATVLEAPSVQLRRRRQASLRCEPLHDGQRDPWTTPNRVVSLRTLHVEVGARTAWLFGDNVFALLDRVGIERRQWDYHRRVWMIPVQFADDVMAFAEWKLRRVVTCEAVDR